MKYLRKYIKQILHETYKPQYRYLYHGTTEDAANNIKANGFDTSLVGQKSGDGLNPGISFTIDGDQAAEHAFWAASKQGDISQAAIVVVSPANLRIMNGTEFNQLWDESGSRNKAISIAAESGFDAIEYFDYETGDGIEEMEVLIISINKIKISHVNWIDPDDYPNLIEEYS